MENDTEGPGRDAAVREEEGHGGGAIDTEEEPLRILSTQKDQGIE